MAEQQEQETPHLIVGAGLPAASGGTGQQQDTEPATAGKEN